MAAVYSRAARRLRAALDDPPPERGEEYRAARVRIALVVAAGCVGVVIAVIAGVVVQAKFGQGIAVGWCGLMMVFSVSHIFWWRLSVFLRSASSPEAAVRALYLLALFDPRRAWTLLLPSDRDDWRRAPVVYLPPGALEHPTPVFSNPESFGDYWKSLSGRSVSRMMHIVTTIRKTLPLRPDLALVIIDVGFRTRSPRALKISLLLCVIAPVLVAGGVALLAHLNAVKNLGPWVLVLLIPAMGAIGIPCMFLLASVLPQPIETITLTKLAVRSGKDWHVFNGELMGPEEVDLSWLEQVGIAPPPPDVSN